MLWVEAASIGMDVTPIWFQLIMVKTQNVRWRTDLFQFDLNDPPGISHTIGHRALIQTAASGGRLYNDALLAYIAKLVNSGTFVDIGGALGLYSVTIAKMVSASRVVCYEPHPVRCACILNNITLNGMLSNVELRPYGLSSTNDDRFLHGKPVSILDEENLYDVSVVRIGLRNDPCSVLHGAEELLRKQRPFLFIRIAQDSEMSKARALMESLGYRQGDHIFADASTCIFLPDETAEFPESLRGIDLVEQLKVPESMTEFVRRREAKFEMNFGDGAGHSRIFFSVGGEGLDIPPPQSEFRVQEEDDLFLEIGASCVGEADLSVILNFYSNGNKISQQKFSHSNGIMHLVRPVPSVDTVRPILRVNGRGSIRINKFRLLIG